MTRKIAAIVNPYSGGGKTGRAWPAIEKKLTRALGPVTTYMTEGAATPHHLPAAGPTAKALKDGADLVIAVGGDGTINEVVNGFFEEGKPINPEAAFTFLNTGTGGDFRKTFGYDGTLDEAIEKLGKAEASPIDIGKLTFIAEDGHETARYFDNIASFGLSGAVDRAVNKAGVSKLLGGKFAFFWGTLKTVLTYRPQAVRVTTDSGFDEVRNISTLAVANGRFFGGGMMMAPHAKPDDGLFDIVMMCDTTFKDMFSSSGSLYEGTHLANPKVTSLQAKVLEARPAEENEIVLLDIDGEAPGRLPARFEILPAALNLFR